MSKDQLMFSILIPLKFTGSFIVCSVLSTIACEVAAEKQFGKLPEELRSRKGRMSLKEDDFLPPSPPFSSLQGPTQGYGNITENHPLEKRKSLPCCQWKPQIG